jgi:UbiD family decarboxylase
MEDQSLFRRIGCRPIRHVLQGKDIDVFKFPAPKLHRDDGGKYIGHRMPSYKNRKEIGSISHARVQVKACSERVYISRQTNQLIAEQY